MSDADKPIITLFPFEFNGHRLTAMTIDGETYLIANQVGAALGYKEGALVTMIGSEWRGELQDGQHTHVLTNGRLSALKSVLDRTRDPGAVGARAKSLLLLTEPGLWRVLILTGKPAGIRLRDLLDSQVLPQIRKTGTYSLPGATPAISGPAPEPEPDPKRINSGPKRSESDRPAPLRLLRAMLSRLGAAGEVSPAAQVALDVVLTEVEQLPGPGLDALPITGTIDDAHERDPSDGARKVMTHRVVVSIPMLSGADLERLDLWIRTRGQRMNLVSR